jgi:hypothetical protein
MCKCINTKNKQMDRYVPAKSQDCQHIHSLLCVRFKGNHENRLFSVNLGLYSVFLIIYILISSYLRTMINSF